MVFFHPWLLVILTLIPPVTLPHPLIVILTLIPPVTLPHPLILSSQTNTPIHTLCLPFSFTSFCSISLFLSLFLNHSLLLPPSPLPLFPTGGNRAGIIYADILMSVYEDIALKHDQYMSVLRTCYGQLNHSLIHSFIHSFIHSLTHSLIHSLIHSFTHSLIHSLTHSLIHSLIHSLTHSLIHSFTHSFNHLFIHFLIHTIITHYSKTCTVTLLYAINH